MPKPLYLTEEMIQEILEDARARLLSMTLKDGKHTLELSYDYQPEDPKHPETEWAHVFFTKKAWDKQTRLINEFSDEVGWHGLCRRDAEDDARFIVEDLLVFPQEVTGASVYPTQEEYQEWNNDLPDNLLPLVRYHGHSHVNMGTTPSSTDEKWQQDMLGRLNGDGLTGKGLDAYLESLGDTYFYVFMIWNKKGEVNARIYDMQNNCYYSEKEVVIEHEVDELDEFIRDAKAKVRPYRYQKTKYPEQRQNAALPQHTAASQRSQEPEDEDPASYPYGYEDAWDWWRQSKK